MSRLIKIPSILDPHCHLRDLSWSHKATFYSETSAALAGGYWAVFDMPNTPPETISREALNTKIEAIASHAVCDWGIFVGASQADNTAEYAAMVDDSCGLKIFNNSTTGNLLIGNQPMRDKHYVAWPGKRIIAVHAEEETVLDILEMVRKYRKRTHFLHISTAKEIEYLRAAKEEGLPITIGVCPHHLFMTEADVETMRGYAMMKPPLKTQADVDVLWQAINDGLVDVIESDHAPHTRADKEAEKPAYGVTGLETTLPLMLTAVDEGRLSLERVIELVAENPRKIWGLPSPDETYALLDLEAEYTIDNDKLLTQCGWSPFDGKQVKGKVLETWIRGTKVYDGEQVLVEAGFGENLFGSDS
jgi:carbamoyl-phosphate synthase/aspartate carbamoyltransferase/dihydroorotase